MSRQIPTAIWMALFAEAQKHFGAPSGWNTYHVGRWLSERVRALQSGNAPPPVEPHKPADVLSFTRLVERDEPATQWDELGDL